MIFLDVGSISVCAIRVMKGQPSHLGFTAQVNLQNLPITRLNSEFSYPIRTQTESAPLTNFVMKVINNDAVMGFLEPNGEVIDIIGLILDCLGKFSSCNHWV